MASSHYIVMYRRKRIINPTAGHTRALPLIWTAAEVRKLRNAKVCYLVADTKTQKTRWVGRGCKVKNKRL